MGSTLASLSTILEGELAPVVMYTAVNACQWTEYTVLVRAR